MGMYLNSFSHLQLTHSLYRGIAATLIHNFQEAKYFQFKNANTAWHTWRMNCLAGHVDGTKLHRDSIAPYVVPEKELQRRLDNLASERIHKLREIQDAEDQAVANKENINTTHKVCVRKPPPRDSPPPPSPTRISTPVNDASDSNGLIYIIIGGDVPGIYNDR
jgi:hypothetical protein